MMTYNINDKKQFPRYHLYTCMDGVNLFSTSPITVDDILVIRGEKYELGKGKDMTVKSNKRTKDGLYYQEFTIKKI